MKPWMAGLLGALFATGAAAQCYPPPGLPIQQWFALCGPTLQQAYSQGMGQGMPFDAFVGGVYQQYAANSMAQMGPPPQMSRPMPQGAFACSLGATRCTNGWVYRCEPVGNNTMWKTGAQRC